MEPNMRGKSYLQASSIKKIDKKTTSSGKRKRKNIKRNRKVKFMDQQTETTKYIEQLHNIITQVTKRSECNKKEATIMVIIINDINTRMSKDEHSFAETYSLKAGMRKFGEQGYNSVYQEVKQLHDRTCFNPISVTTMTQKERKRALESLIFLTEASKETGWEEKTHQAQQPTWRA